MFSTNYYKLQYLLKKESFPEKKTAYAFVVGKLCIFNR